MNTRSKHSRLPDKRTTDLVNSDHSTREQCKRFLAKHFSASNKTKNENATENCNHTILLTRSRSSKIDAKDVKNLVCDNCALQHTQRRFLHIKLEYILHTICTLAATRIFPLILTWLNWIDHSVNGRLKRKSIYIKIKWTIVAKVFGFYLIHQK